MVKLLARFYRRLARDDVASLAAVLALSAVAFAFWCWRLLSSALTVQILSGFLLIVVLFCLLIGVPVEVARRIDLHRQGVLHRLNGILEHICTPSGYPIERPREQKPEQLDPVMAELIDAVKTSRGPLYLFSWNLLYCWLDLDDEFLRRVTDPIVNQSFSVLLWNDGTKKLREALFNYAEEVVVVLPDLRIRGVQQALHLREMDSAPTSQGLFKAACVAGRDFARSLVSERLTRHSKLRDPTRVLFTPRPFGGRLLLASQDCFLQIVRRHSPTISESVLHFQVGSDASDAHRAHFHAVQQAAAAVVAELEWL